MTAWQLSDEISLWCYKLLEIKIPWVNDCKNNNKIISDYNNKNESLILPIFFILQNESSDLDYYIFLQDGVSVKNKIMDLFH